VFVHGGYPLDCALSWRLVIQNEAHYHANGFAMWCQSAYALSPRIGGNFLVFSKFLALESRCLHDVKKMVASFVGGWCGCAAVSVFKGN
jgi:hypothetical protein